MTDLLDRTKPRSLAKIEAAMSGGEDCGPKEHPSFIGMSGDQVRCEHCEQPFTPRSGNGGRKQKFCAEACRRAADNARQFQRDQRGPQRGDEDAPSATETRAMLVEGVKAFHAKFPDQATGTAEEAVDLFIQTGKLGKAAMPEEYPGGFPSGPEPGSAASRHFGFGGPRLEPGNSGVAFHEQCHLDWAITTDGDVLFTQTDGVGNVTAITVHRSNMERFADLVCDLAGIGRSF